MPTTKVDGPRRTCVGCRATRHPRHLIRVVRTADGSLALGRTLPGRGAWLCSGSPTCLELAVRRGGFARSFRSPVNAAATGALREEVAGSDPPETPTDFVPG